MSLSERHLHLVFVYLYKISFAFQSDHGVLEIENMDFYIICSSVLTLAGIGRPASLPHI